MTKVSLAAIILACITLTYGCTTPDSLMKMSLVRGTEDEPDTAMELAVYAGDAQNQPGMRAWALRSLSRLRNVPVSVIERLGGIVQRENENAAVRSWAAIALGEFRRKESLPYFITALKSRIDPTTGYYVLEGLSRNLSMILEDTDLNERLVAALGLFAAHQTGELPSMYELLNEYVCNLPVVVLVLEKNLQQRNATAMQRTMQEEIYASVYRVLVTIEMARKKYVSGYDNYETTLKRAFDASFSAVKINYRPLYLLTAWYAGVLGNNPELAALSADHLVRWLRDADPRLRFVVTWSLMRMELYRQSASEALVQRVLRTETDGQVLRLLGEISTIPGESDAIQQLMRIRLRGMERQQ